MRQGRNDTFLLAAIDTTTSISTRKTLTTQISVQTLARTFEKKYKTQNTNKTSTSHAFLEKYVAFIEVFRVKLYFDNAKNFNKILVLKNLQEQLSLYFF